MSKSCSIVQSIKDSLRTNRIRASTVLDDRVRLRLLVSLFVLSFLVVGCVQPADRVTVWDATTGRTVTANAEAHRLLNDKRSDVILDDTRADTAFSFLNETDGVNI